MLGQGLSTAVLVVPVALVFASLTVRSLPFEDILFIVISELLAVNVLMISAFVLQGTIGIPAASRLRMVVVGTRLFTVLTLFAIDSLTIRLIGMVNTGLFAVLTIMGSRRTPPQGGHIHSAGQTYQGRHEARVDLCHPHGRLEHSARRR